MIVTLLEMKQRLGIAESVTTWDAFLTQQINLVSSVVNRYCGRFFEQKRLLQKFYTSDNFQSERKRLYLYNYPSIEIHSVKMIDSSHSKDIDHRVNKRASFLERVDNGYSIWWFRDCSHGGFIEVDYTSGFSPENMPLEVKEVVFNVVEERYNKKISGIDMNYGSDIQRVSIPGVMSIEYDYSNKNKEDSEFSLILGNNANMLSAFRTERAYVPDIKEVYLDES